MNIESLKIKIHDYMNSLYNRGYFNGSYLVSYKGEILIKNSYGKASFEFDIPNYTDTKFKIASLTKAFTAIAILQLNEKKLLLLDDNLNDFYDDYPNGEKIKIHNLLNHTSGIVDFVSFPDYWEKNMRLQTSIKKIISSFKDKPLEFEPGENFKYCTSAYILLTDIIEKISGLNYEEYLEKYIFAPLGMKNTGRDDGRKIVKNLANGYSIWEDVVHTEYVDMSIPLGGYGLYSTVEDLHLWDKALDSSQLVKEELINKMFTPYNGICGYDWFITEVEMNNTLRKKTYYRGDINGFSAYFSKYIDDGLSIIVLSNINITPVEIISDNIAKMFFGEDVKLLESLNPININDFDYKKVIGVYIDDDRTIEISFNKNNLYLTTSKLFGAIFKYKLIPLYMKNNEVTFATEFVDEKVIINLDNPDYIKMYYYDIYKDKTSALKIN